MNPFLFPGLILLATLIACLLSWWLGKIGRAEEFAALTNSCETIRVAHANAVLARENAAAQLRTAQAELATERENNQSLRRYSVLASGDCGNCAKLSADLTSEREASDVLRASLESLTAGLNSRRKRPAPKPRKRAPRAKKAR